MKDRDTGQITVNGEPHDWQDRSMTELLKDFDVAPDKPGVAVALNSDVLPRGDWQSVRVKPGDRIEIVHIVRGG